MSGLQALPTLKLSMATVSKIIYTRARVLKCSLAFKTDTDISNKTAGRRERELTDWSADVSGAPANANVGTLGDEATFGSGTTGGNTSWDQFAANEKMFGVTTSFNEEMYTTKLDRNAADFKERERKAQQIANEIMGVSQSRFVHYLDNR